MAKKVNIHYQTPEGRNINNPNNNLKMIVFELRTNAMVKFINPNNQIEWQKVKDWNNYNMINNNVINYVMGDITDNYIFLNIKLFIYFKLILIVKKSKLI